MSLHRACSCLVLALLASAAPSAAQTFVFHLRGDQEVPPVPSTATGGCFGSLDQVAHELELTCVHDVTGPTVMHIHRGAAGVNGEVAFDLGDPASPVTATWAGMTGADVADLLAGNLYVNIHTSGRPAGEIRGQMLERTVDGVSFTATGAQVVPPNASGATASCTADLDGPASALAIECTHDLPAPETAHVHAAPFGENGPIVFTFPSAASPLSANVPMTPLLVARFAAGHLYLVVQGPAGTEDESGDAIRGQIGDPPAGADTAILVVTKQTFPPGGAGFGFSETVTPGSFPLADGGSQVFAGVAPGTYTVSEDDPAVAPGGYSLADVRCDDLDSAADVPARTATAQLAAGEVVTCAFRNVQTAPTDQLFVFHLSGDQEVPPVVSPSRGGCFGAFDAGASELTLVCTHDVSVPTLMHVHRGVAGAIGDVVFDLGDPTSPVIATWSGMTPAAVADLLAGNFYVNIHTGGRPLGEIRGQLLPRTVDTVAFTADGAQSVPPGSTPATASCVADLADDATELAVSCTHDLPSPVAAHLHQGPPGVNGPVAHDFASPASPIGEDAPLTPRLVADFAAGLLYLEIHGTEGGEDVAGSQIRGRIAPPAPVVTTGTIRIVKATVPGGGSGFAFTDDVPGSPGAFSLDDGGEREFGGVAPGTYTITETLLPGYALADVSCDDGDSAGNVAARSAAVSLQAGETVTCTFRNLQVPPAGTLFVFHLSGDQEAPPVPGAARGGCFASLDAGAGTLSMLCVHDVAGATVMHVHRGAPGVNGPVLFDLGDPLSPVVALWTGMTAGDVSDLLAGNLYVNVHTAGRPAGEIRGQILPRTVDAFGFPMSGAQVVPPTGSPARGSCAADLSGDAASLLLRCQHDVAGAAGIHLHEGAPGAEGPVVFDFPVAPAFEGIVPMTPRLVADFAAGFLYADVHSVDAPDGEIRGQLLPGQAGLAEIPTLGEGALLALALALAALGARRLVS